MTTPTNISNPKLQKAQSKTITLEIDEDTNSFVPVNKVAVRVMKVATLTPKAEMFKKLNEGIPNNDYGLPTYYYRADILSPELIDPEHTSEDEQSDFLEAAIIDLDYSQGFPVTPTGEPFWGQLPYEPSEQYRAFIAFLELPTRGESNGGPQAVRQMHVLCTQLNTDTRQILESSYLYYWQVRARAYDLFKAASHAKLKERRLMSAEDEHYNMAAQYIAWANTFLTNAFQDPESAGLKPKDVMDLMHRMIQVQRLSAGASPFSQALNKNDTNPLPQNATLEVILRTLAQNSGLITTNTSAADAAAEQEATQEDLTKKLLQNPEMLQQAQELIIRVNTDGSRTRNLAPIADDGHTIG